MPKPKVLLIGWDAADWKLFRPLLENNEAPAVASMMKKGVSGNLATLQPVLSPMLWNSIATGKRPYKHGIHGFTEVNPHTNVVGPSLSTSRKCKAIWNMLSQEGYKAHVVNWFASHPAEKISGTYISELYSKIPRNWKEKWTIGSDVVHPESKKDLYQDLRLHPTELEGSLLQMFAAAIDELDQEKDQRVKSLAQLVAEVFTIHNAVTHIVENEDWDFVGVYYGSIDHFCHGFMHYHPPQMAGISDKDFKIFKDVIPNVYRLHDRMLGRLMQLAGPDTTVIVCSDHGFQSDHLRPHSTPLVPAGPAIWHRDQGMIMMQGPDIIPGDTVHGANLIDITPTVLRVFDLPTGRDMDGRSLNEAFKLTTQVKTIASWEDRKGEHPDGMHDASAKISEAESKAILDQFVALGYIDPPSEDADEAATTTKRETDWNLARSYIDGGQLGPAVEILERLVDKFPERRDYVATFSNCLAAMGMKDVSFALKAAMHDAQERDHISATMARAELALANEEWEKALELLESVNLDEIDFTASGGTGLTSRLLVMGTSYMNLREWEKAIDVFQRALDIDEDFPRAYLGIAQCYLRMSKYDEAIDAALSAVELEHHLGPAHYTLGVALAKSGDHRRAIDAYTTALRYSPGAAQIHRRMAVSYRHLGGFDDLVTQHRMMSDSANAMRKATPKPEVVENAKEFRDKWTKRAEELRPFYIDLTKKEKKEAEEREAKMKSMAKGELKEPVAPPKTFILVSGLPRSGTSLAMQMLAAGGLPPMTDGEREADEDNPEGYLEWESIKKVKANPEMLEQAEGKAIKVISMLLPSLPKKYRYKVLFVMRPVEEIVASQEKMIKRRGSTGADLDSAALTESLTRHRKEIIELLSNMPVQVMPISYHRILENPDKAAKRIAKFLGKDVLPHPEKMADAVRPDLYRNRKVKKKATDADAQTEDDLQEIEN